MPRLRTPQQRAADPNTPLHDLAILAETHPAEVANNPGLLLELATGQAFAQRLTSNAFTALLTTPDTPAPLLLHLVSELPSTSYMRHDYARQALAHPNLPPEGFTLIQNHIHHGYLAEADDYLERHHHNPTRWQGDPTTLLRDRLRTHGIFSDLLTHITALPTWAVEALEHNPHLRQHIPAWKAQRTHTKAQPLPALPMLAMDCALLALELDPHPDPRILELANAHNPTIRLALAHNPTTPKPTLQRLANDPDLAVSQTAHHTLNHPSRAAGGTQP